MERIKLDKHVRFYKHAKINFIFDGHEMRRGKGEKLFLILPSTTWLDIWFTSYGTTKSKRSWWSKMHEEMPVKHSPPPTPSSGP